MSICCVPYCIKQKKAHSRTVRPKTQCPYCRQTIYITILNDTMNRARIFIKEKCMYHLGFYIKIVYHLARPILALFTIQVKHQYVFSLYILYKKVKARFWGTLNKEVLIFGDIFLKIVLVIFFQENCTVLAVHLTAEKFTTPTANTAPSFIAATASTKNRTKSILPG